ncbi:phage tail protein [Hymenobacter duratus]|nr:tail fiber protein [Hymenobacter duratus]
MRLIATPAGIVPASSHAPQAEPERRGWLKRLGALIGGSLLAGTAAAGTRGTASVQGEYVYIGEIIMFAGNFPPRGYAFCDGQILAIAQNTALFSLLGTTYGGNGQTTFALPDLRGRFPMHAGQGPGLSPHNLGERAGVENVTLTINQMPLHNHTMGGAAATTSPGNTNNPSGALLANDGAGGAQYATGVSSNATLAGGSTNAAGGSQPHDNMPPYQCINFCIALEGIYPSRN